MMKPRFVQTCLCLGVLAASVHAQCPPGPFTSLFGTGASSQRQFGYAVAMRMTPAGELLLVATDNFFGANPIVFSGAAFAFRGVPNGSGAFTWSQEALLAPQPVVASDQVGSSVSITAANPSVTLAIMGGAFVDTPAGSDAGAAFIFLRSAGAPFSWSQEARLLAPDGAPGDQFGLTVAIDGDIAAVGAPLDDTPVGPDAGSVYIFVRTNPSTWTFEQKILAPDAMFADRFGSAVALRGDVLLVGSPRQDQVAENAGAAYLFKRAGSGGSSTWNMAGKLIAPDGLPSDFFGQALALREDVAIIGAPLVNDADRGAAYVFARHDSAGSFSYDFETRLAAPPAEEGNSDHFGEAVDYSHGLAIIGVYRDANPGVNTGSATIFRRDTSGASPVWTETSKFIVPGTMTADDFGYAVSTDGGRLAVSATASDQYGLNRGNVYTLAAPAPPVVVTPPVDQSLTVGGTLFLTVVPGGQTPFSFQWRRDGTPLTDDGRITGSGTAALSITALTEADEGEYEVLVSNSCGGTFARAQVAIAPPACPGDANGDLVVDFADVTSVLANFGASYSPGTGPGDADHNGGVNFADVIKVLMMFGVPCA